MAEDTPDCSGEIVNNSQDGQMSGQAEFILDWGGDEKREVNPDCVGQRGSKSDEHYYYYPFVSDVFDRSIYIFIKSLCFS